MCLVIIIYQFFNFCCFRALAYTLLDKLQSVFFYIISYKEINSTNNNI